MPRSSFKFNASSLLMWSAGILAAYFLVTAALDLWRYGKFEKKSIAVVDQWTILEPSSSQFAIQAGYSFTYQGEEYRGKTTFSKPYHLNRLSAEKQIKTHALQKWPVWVYPRHPEQNTLEHRFPLKKCLYSLMVLGVFVYFIYLKEQTSKSL